MAFLLGTQNEFETAMVNGAISIRATEALLYNTNIKKSGI